MTKLVCSKCEVELLINKSGVAVVEHASFGPYKIWMADEFKCPNCGATIVAGFGGAPIALHFDPDFHTVLENIALHPEIIRNDFENQAQREKAAAV